MVGLPAADGNTLLQLFTCYMAFLADSSKISFGPFSAFMGHVNEEYIYMYVYINTHTTYNLHMISIKAFSFTRAP